MAILDDILAILKGANPSADDSTLQTQAAQLASHPDAASVMAPLNISPSNFDVAVSDNTVTQNGRPDSLPSQPMPASPAPSLPPMPPPAPTAAPVSPAPTAAAKPAAPAPATPPAPSSPTPELPVSSSDQASRDTALAQATRNRNIGTVGSTIAGIGDAIAGAGKGLGVNLPMDVQQKVLDRANQTYATQKQEAETKISNDPNSEASKSARALVLQIAPQLANQPGFNTMTDQELRDKLPLVDTMMKAKAAEDAKRLSMEQMKSNRDISLGLREDQQQDKLEQNAKQMVSNLRGDKSLARSEEQRDAAIVAYNRLNEVKKSGAGLNSVDYVDILGQIYKARTGTAPGEQVLKDIRQATAEGSLGKAYTYITGKQAPATSQAITDSLINLTHSMGKQADQFHDSYMKAHLIKPSGLEDSRWQPIVSTGRGVSFDEATKAPTQAAGAPSSTSDPLGIR